MIKVLFVTYDFPYPLNSGGKNRAYNLIKFAKKDDIGIDLLSFVRENFEYKNLEELKKIGVNNIEIYKRRKVKSVLTIGKNLVTNDSIFKTLYNEKKFFNVMKKMIKENNIDIIHFESSYVGYYIGKELKKIGVKQILGTENIEYILYEDFLKSSRNIMKKPILSYQIKRFKNEEEKMMRDADISIAVTKEEAAHISSISNKKCEVIENAINLRELNFKFDSKNNNNILFVGNFTYMPNVQAIKYFIDKVLPILDKKITLTIIGRRIKDLVPKTKQIIALEYVQDLVSEYRKADLLVFPIRIGGGTNFKILEAMALGVPVVAFPQRLSGIGARKGVHYFEVNSAEDFVREIEAITTDKKIASEVVKNARSLVEQNYSWEKVGDKLSNVWRSLV